MRTEIRQFEESVEQLREMLEAVNRGIVFTGPGISTESGIPDFRGPGGIWTKYRPIDFQEFLASQAAQREYWHRKFATHDAVVQAEPNQGHRAVAELVKRGKVSAVITQNIDGLGGMYHFSQVPCIRKYTEPESLQSKKFRGDETSPDLASLIAFDAHKSSLCARLSG